MFEKMQKKTKKENEKNRKIIFLNKLSNNHSNTTHFAFN